jgi:hypothetical protein
MIMFYDVYEKVLKVNTRTDADYPISGNGCNGKVPEYGFHSLHMDNMKNSLVLFN